MQSNKMCIETVTMQTIFAFLLGFEFSSIFEDLNLLIKSPPITT